ncbi:MAG: EamA family transporter [Saprospiraceae bacterium]|nr:EamA family transporter [Saprospiraceae bacterium]
MSLLTQRKAYIALGITCIIWGTTYLVNKIGVSQVSPILFSAIRQSIAGSILLWFCFSFKKFSFPDRKYLLFQLILGIVLIGIGNGIGIVGLSYIDSGLAAILAATSPIIIAILNQFYFPANKLNLLGWLGILIGFIGLVLICSDKINLDSFADTEAGIGIGLTLVSVIAWGAGSVLSKTKSFAHSTLMSSGFQMLFGSIPMYLLIGFTKNPTLNNFNATAIWSMVYVIIFGSILAYSAFIYALNHLPAIITGIQSYISPIIALILGFLILNEQINGVLLIGSALVLGGVFLVNYSEWMKLKK